MNSSLAQPRSSVRVSSDYASVTYSYQAPGLHGLLTKPKSGKARRFRWNRVATISIGSAATNFIVHHLITKDSLWATARSTVNKAASGRTCNEAPSRITRTFRAQDAHAIKFDPDKIDDAVLALLALTMFEVRGVTRAWKGHAWDAMDRLHRKRYIGDPKSKSKSVVLTDGGKRKAVALFEKLFLPSGPATRAKISELER